MTNTGRLAAYKSKTTKFERFSKSEKAANQRKNQRQKLLDQRRPFTQLNDNKVEDKIATNKENNGNIYHQAYIKPLTNN